MHLKKASRIKDGRIRNCLKTNDRDHDWDRRPLGQAEGDEGIFPKGYVRALLSVSARHSLTRARAWIIPGKDQHHQNKSILGYEKKNT